MIQYNLSNSGEVAERLKHSTYNRANCATSFTGSNPVLSAIGLINETSDALTPEASKHRKLTEGANDTQGNIRSRWVKIKPKERNMPNFLPISRKLLVLSALVEGNSICSIVRMTGTHKTTILRVLQEAGEKAQETLDREMMNLQCKDVQVDEIWTFVGKKQKRCSAEEKLRGEVGDQYVFVALDADTKLVPAFRVGKRNLPMSVSFMRELQARIDTRFQLSTDSFAPYLEAVDSVFGLDVDYAQIHKKYGEEIVQEKRYSPAQIIGITIKPLIGNPVRKRISTSYVERQNLTMRMNMRRFTRLTNGYSKKLENLKAAIALHFFHYNFMRIHQSLRVTPAMESGLTNRIWTWEDLLSVNAEKRAA